MVSIDFSATSGKRLDEIVNLPKLQAYEGHFKKRLSHIVSKAQQAQQAKKYDEQGQKQNSHHLRNNYKQDVKNSIARATNRISKTQAQIVAKIASYAWQQFYENPNPESISQLREILIN